MNSQNPGYKANNTIKKSVNQKRRAQGLIISFLCVIFGITILCFIIMGIIE